MRAVIKTTMSHLGMKNIVLLVFGFVATSMIIAGCAELTGPKSPETPTDVTATLLTGSSVRVDWKASPQSDGVISYNIIRNGTKVGESTGTSFTDTGLTEVTAYAYSISANCTSGLLSDASAVTAASTVTTADVTPPRVTANQPPNGFTAVSTSATVTATFSEAMDPATLNTTTFTLRVTATGALIPATVAYAPVTRIAELTPVSQLPSATNLTATVTTGAKDIHGVALAANFVWAFTTLDEAPPSVIATNPTNGAAGVSTTAPNITATFSEPMDANTINSTAFTLQRTSNGVPVTGTVAYAVATRTASFTPSAPLVPGVNYTATIAASVKDVAGNPLGTAYQFSFTTADTNPPTLILTAPANLATGVATNVVVTAGFSEAMDPATISTTTFTLKVAATSAAVAGTVVYNAANSTATFTPTAALLSSTAYIATVTTGAKDLAGNPLAASVIPNPWTFTTAAAPTTTTVTADKTSPQEFGTSIVFTAQVNTTGAGTPAVDAGTVRFIEGGTCAAPTTTLQAATAVAPSGAGKGSVTFTTAALAVGAHTIKACYDGAVSGLASEGSMAFTINNIATTTTVTADKTSPQEPGTSIVFTATVTRTTGGSAVTTGSVGFYDGGTCGTPGPQLQAPAAVSGTGTKTLTTSTLSNGAHTILACFTPPTNFAASAGTLPFTIQFATTTTVTSDLATPQASGTSIVFTAEVNRTIGGTDVLSGNVVFYDGGSCAAPGPTLQASQAVNGTGRVTYTTTSLSVATHTILACYLGTTDFATSSGTKSFTIAAIPITSVIAALPVRTFDM